MAFTQLFSHDGSLDPAILLTRLQAFDPSVGVYQGGGTVFVTKAAVWTAQNILDAQAIIDASPALTAQRLAQNTIDQWPIELKALVLALIDQLNVIRAALPAPLVAITPAQALAAIRNKAATL